MANHRPENIGARGPRSGSPTATRCGGVARGRVARGTSFLLNVALNHQRQITGVFAGDLIAAHRAGLEFVRASAMRPVDALFDLVVTTNSGAPLDLNLYQGVKGMSAAARIVKPGGAVVLACECREGGSRGKPVRAVAARGARPGGVARPVTGRGEVQPEQWQVQIQAQIQTQAGCSCTARCPTTCARVPSRTVSRRHRVCP